MGNKEKGDGQRRKAWVMYVLWEDSLNIKANFSQWGNGELNPYLHQTLWQIHVDSLRKLPSEDDNTYHRVDAKNRNKYVKH